MKAFCSNKQLPPLIELVAFLVVFGMMVLSGADEAACDHDDKVEEGEQTQAPFPRSQNLVHGSF